MAESEKNIIALADMAGWLRDEVRLVTKTAELQLKEATDFVTAYLTGKISGEEAMTRAMAYDRRWGESKLIAAMPDEATSDKEILRRLDAQNGEEGKRLSGGWRGRSGGGEAQR
jgi:hypothetical protein